MAPTSATPGFCPWSSRRIRLGAAQRGSRPLGAARRAPVCRAGPRGSGGRCAPGRGQSRTPAEQRRSLGCQSRGAPQRLGPCVEPPHALVRACGCLGGGSNEIMGPIGYTIGGSMNSERAPSVGDGSNHPPLELGSSVDDDTIGLREALAVVHETTCNSGSSCPSPASRARMAATAAARARPRRSPSPRSRPSPASPLSPCATLAAGPCPPRCARRCSHRALLAPVTLQMV